MRRGIFSMLEIVSREMRRAVYARIALAGLAAVSVNSATSMAAQNPSSDVAAWQPGRTIVNPVVHQDRSPPLPSLCAVYQARPRPPHGPRPSGAEQAEKPAPIPAVTIGAQGTAVEQVSQGTRPAATLVTSFNGLGVGFTGPQSTADARNPSDDSLAVGPDKIVQVVNSRLAIYTKKGARNAADGTVLFGAVITNTLFAGFGGPCEKMISGDAVVRYDQLAGRWLFVLPIFRRISDRPDAPCAMSYAVSTGPDPLGSYYRYQFNRPLFPDYPRPAVWPDGYYVPTSTGNTVIRKQLCAVDRNKMLEGENALVA